MLGPNGSGKSTLLKVVSGSLSPSEGAVVYENGEQTKVEPENIYEQLSIAAPYVELLEEFTLQEMLAFHFKFKNYTSGFNYDRLIDVLGLEKALDKEIRFFSSGMKQRVKLALTCCSDTPIVLLDEPTSNLDRTGEDWYLDLIQQTIDVNRVLLVGSNQEKEYSFCDEQLHILDFK